MNRTQRMQALQLANNKWELMKLKSFYTTKDTNTQVKKWAAEQKKKIFNRYTCDGEL